MTVGKIYIYIYIYILESIAALGKTFIAQLMICNHCQKEKGGKKQQTPLHEINTSLKKLFALLFYTVLLVVNC